MVKNPPAVQEMQVRSLGQEDPLEEEMATRSSILAWGIPWTEDPAGQQSMGRKESDRTDRLNNKQVSIKAQSILKKSFALDFNAFIVLLFFF